MLISSSCSDPHAHWNSLVLSVCTRGVVISIRLSNIIMAGLPGRICLWFPVRLPHNMGQLLFSASWIHLLSEVSVPGKQLYQSPIVQKFKKRERERDPIANYVAGKKTFGSLTNKLKIFTNINYIFLIFQDLGTIQIRQNKYF